MDKDITSTRQETIWVQVLGLNNVSGRTRLITVLPTVHRTAPWAGTNTLNGYGYDPFNDSPYVPVYEPDPALRYDPYAWRFCGDHIQHPVLIPASWPRVEASRPHHLIHVSVSARRRAIRKRFVHKLRRAS